LLVTKDCGIPLWHKPYEGNINDYTFFKTFVSSLQDKIEVFLKECKSITLIFDKGNNTPTGIKKIEKDLHFYMLGSLAPSQHKDWLQIPLENFSIEYKTAKKEIKKGNINKGMIPKVEACIYAVKNKCPKAHLINGLVPHSLLLEIFTDKGIGTEIVYKNGNE
jgi:transposase